MNTFSIRDIENLCGIKAHTLRIWEQRYNMLFPRRKAGNHRQYDNDDLKPSCCVSPTLCTTTAIGFPRSPNSTRKGLIELTLQTPQPGSANEIFINHLMEASIDLDPELFDRVLHNIILHMGFEKGDHTGSLSLSAKDRYALADGKPIPAQEHFANALISKLHVAIHGLDGPLQLRPARKGRVALSAPAANSIQSPSCSCTT